MTIILYSVFFLSGMSALMFETLWFRLAGLALGNSIWAATLVLTGFMGGLAIGNGFSIRYGRRIQNPLRGYAITEVVIATTGFAVILLLPVLTEWLVPIFQPLLKHEFILNTLRFLVAFLLMLIPSSAMGATLPLMVKALHNNKNSFGYTLGKLYGLNTLGAVAGALIGDLFLIRLAGIRGTGIIAASFSMLAASGAFFILNLYSKANSDGRASLPVAENILSLLRNNKRLLSVSFISGGIFLALEVVWFRFLVLFYPSQTLVFSVMLAIVLVGIGFGGFLASFWLRINHNAYSLLPSVLFLSGVMLIALYSSFDHWLQAFLEATSFMQYLFPSLYLMLPVSVLSGSIFTLIGSALHSRVQSEFGATGLLALSNTMGAMLGAALAGFILIPELGMEKSFFLLALAYGMIALVLVDKNRLTAPGRGKYITCLAMFLFISSSFLFPFQLMEKTYLSFARRGVLATSPSLHLIASREGLTETIQYMRSDMFDAPYYYRLITNNYSMSASNIAARRYMKLYVYLPMAMKPDAKKALLICFGVGSTAKALVDTKALESIDIVDISRDIIETSAIVFPTPQNNPINDPRVTLHIEDGRFFLLTTPERFDLITSEPPPLKMAGVVNLYTQEYFQLIHDHLVDGGMTTYWLPVRQLTAPDSKAVIKAFCNVFDDCTMWSGAGLELMMVGSRQNNMRISKNDFIRQWRDPLVETELRAVGLDVPQQLATLFLADTAELKELTQDSQALVDNYPLRLDSNVLGDPAPFQYGYWLSALSRPDAFRKSAFIQRLWPKDLLLESEEYIEAQGIINGLFDRAQSLNLNTLDTILAKTPLRSTVLWLMNINEDILANAEKAAEKNSTNKRLPYVLGVRAMSERNYMLAEHKFTEYQKSISGAEEENIAILRMYLHLKNGQKTRAGAVAKELTSRKGTAWITSNRDSLDWLKNKFGDLLL